MAREGQHGAIPEEIEVDDVVVVEYRKYHEAIDRQFEGSVVDLDPSRTPHRKWARASIDTNGDGVADRRVDFGGSVVDLSPGAHQHRFLGYFATFVK